MNRRENQRCRRQPYHRRGQWSINDAAFAWWDMSTLAVTGGNVTSWPSGGTESGCTLGTTVGTIPYNASYFGGRGGCLLNGTTMAFLESGLGGAISTRICGNVSAWWAIGFRATSSAQNNARIIGPAGTQGWQTAFDITSPYTKFRCLRNNTVTAPAKAYTEAVGTTARRVIDTYAPGSHALYLEGAVAAGDPEVWNNAITAGAVRFAIGRLGDVSSLYCAMEVACAAVGVGALTPAQTALVDAWIQARTG